MTVARYEGEGIRVNSLVNIYTVPTGKIAKIKFNFDKFKTGEDFSPNTIRRNEQLFVIGLNVSLDSYGQLYRNAVAVPENITCGIQFGVGSKCLIGTKTNTDTNSGRCIYAMQSKGDSSVLCGVEGSASEIQGSASVAKEQNPTVDGDVSYLSLETVFIARYKNEFILHEGESVWLNGNNSSCKANYDFTVYEETL